MTDDTWLAERFEQRRPRLRAVAYRMLGSASEADDAVQDAWLRVAAADASGVANLDGWFTTIVARVCLNALRARRTRRESALGDDESAPALRVVGSADPEEQAVMADAVGLAVLVVLETLTPDERLAFVLHDMFAVPFDEIAPIVDRSPAAARQLASRARRRVRGAAPGARDPADMERQWRVVEAFVKASREGDFEALLRVLHPDVVVRTDGHIAGPRETRGAAEVARTASSFRRYASSGRPVVVDGLPAAIVVPAGRRPFALLKFTIEGDRIRAIDVVGDPEALAAVAAGSNG